MTEERRWTSEPLTARQRGSLAFLRVNTPLSLLFAVAAAMFDPVSYTHLRAHET